MSTKNKNQTPKSRVMINVAVLVIAAIACACIGIAYARSITTFSEGITNSRVHNDSDAQYCFDKQKGDDGEDRYVNGRICEPDAANPTTITDANRLATFLDGEIAESQDIIIVSISCAIKFVGYSFAAAFLAAAFVYWNHNR